MAYMYQCPKCKLVFVFKEIKENMECPECPNFILKLVAPYPEVAP